MQHEGTHHKWWDDELPKLDKPDYDLKNEKNAMGLQYLTKQWPSPVLDNLQEHKWPSMNMRIMFQPETMINQKIQKPCNQKLVNYPQNGDLRTQVFYCG